MNKNTDKYDCNFPTRHKNYVSWPQFCKNVRDRSNKF